MGLNINVDIDDLKYDISKTKDSIPRGLNIIANQLRDEIALNFPKDTGQTAADFEVVVNGDYEYGIENPNPAALYVYTGREEVTPVSAEALHFFVNGEEVFAKSADAVEANDYITPAMENIISRTDDLAEEVFYNG